MTKVTVTVEGELIGKLSWELPPDVPKGMLSQEDAETIGMMLKPHLVWIVSVLISGLKMGHKMREWFAHLRKTEATHDAEALRITLS